MRDVALAAFVLAGVSFAQPASAAGDPKHGEYVASLSGCNLCHTDPKKKNAPLAGGVALKTVYGTFYMPNITPDLQTGIGGWSEADFVRAMTEGVAPDGSHYYPAFPYTSYTRMRRQDIRDLKAYLDTVRPVRNAVPSHDLRFPYNFRFALGVWKWLYFRTDSFKPDPGKSTFWNRGAYLVTGPGHCGECHTVRNFLGATDATYSLAGMKKGVDGKRVGNITPHPKDGIGLWSAVDIVDFLKTGQLPFGERTDPPMDDVVARSTAHWMDADLKATAEYLLSLPQRETP